MSLEKAKKYLTEQGYADHVIELEESSATVQLAAEALDVEPGMIAKTMSFLTEDGPILILTEGTAKIAYVHLELETKSKYIWMNH